MDLDYPFWGLFFRLLAFRAYTCVHYYYNTILYCLLFSWICTDQEGALFAPRYIFKSCWTHTHVHIELLIPPPKVHV